MAPRKAGVSRKVRIAGPYVRPEAEAPRGDSPSTEDPPAPSTSNLPPPTQVLSLAQVAAARDTAQIKYTAQLQSIYSVLLVLLYIDCGIELSHESREALADMRDTPVQDDVTVLDEAPGVDGNLEEDWVPLGDFLDNDQAFTEAMRETFEHTYVPSDTLCPIKLVLMHNRHSRHRVYRDTRTWRQRLERQQLNWSAIFTSLTEAFLQWKYPTSTLAPDPPTASCDTPAIDVDPIYDFTIDCVDLYTLSTSIHVPRTSSMTAAEALMIQGYIVTSPVDPTLAISVKTLELFRRLRCRKASLSVEAYAKVLCDLYAVSNYSVGFWQYPKHVIDTVSSALPKSAF